MNVASLNNTEIKDIITTSTIPFIDVIDNKEVTISYSIADMIRQAISKGNIYELIDNAYSDYNPELPFPDKYVNLLVGGFIDFELDLGYPDAQINSPEYITFTNPIYIILGHALLNEGTIERVKKVLLVDEPEMLISMKISKLMKPSLKDQRAASTPKKDIEQKRNRSIQFIKIKSTSGIFFKSQENRTEINHEKIHISTFPYFVYSGTFYIHSILEENSISIVYKTVKSIDDEVPDFNLIHEDDVWFVYITKAGNKLMLYDSKKEGIIMKR